MRIRYYGFLANRFRAEKLQLARRLINHQTSSTENANASVEPTNPQAQTPAETTDDFDICPLCKQGRLVVILRVGYPVVQKSWSFDSS